MLRLFESIVVQLAVLYFLVPVLIAWLIFSDPIYYLPPKKSDANE